MKHTRTNGFTLLETLMSVLILSLAVVVPMTIASRTLFSSTVARDQVTASYLAQEAIETLRSVRDLNKLSGAVWDNAIPSRGSNFTIDAVNYLNNYPTMAVCAGTCSPLNYDSTTHLYQHGSQSGTNTASPFTRTVRTDSVSGNTSEMTISVTVSWNVGSTVRTFTARENLLDWQN